MAVDYLLQEDRCVDLVIPRGGPGLIRKVTETSRIPVIKHDAGVCHIFIDASADAEMARKVVSDSKLSQMAVCNGLETLLVHRDASENVMPEVLKALHEEGVELRGDERTCEIFGDAIAARESDWSEEYLAPILAVRVVDDMDAAIDHIRTYGSDHTEVIITQDYARSEEFLRRVNSSTVGVNCSTAFADGDAGLVNDLHTVSGNAFTDGTSYDRHQCRTETDDQVAFGLAVLLVECHTKHLPAPHVLILFASKFGTRIIM